MKNFLLVMMIFFTSFILAMMVITPPWNKKEGFYTDEGLTKWGISCHNPDIPVEGSDGHWFCNHWNTSPSYITFSPDYWCRKQLPNSEFAGDFICSPIEDKKP